MKYILFVIPFIIVSCSSLDDSCECIKSSANEFIIKGEMPSLDELEGTCSDYISSYENGSIENDSITTLLFEAMTRIKTKEFYLINGKVPSLKPLDFSNPSDFRTVLTSKGGEYKLWQCDISIDNIYLGTYTEDKKKIENDSILIYLHTTNSSDEPLLSALISREVVENSKLMPGIKYTGEVWDTQRLRYLSAIEKNSKIVNYIENVVNKEYLIGYSERISEYDEEFKSDVWSYAENVTKQTWSNNRINYVARHNGYQNFSDDLYKGRYISINKETFESLMSNTKGTFCFNSMSLKGKLLKNNQGGYYIEIKSISNNKTSVPLILKKLQPFKV